MTMPPHQPPPGPYGPPQPSSPYGGQQFPHQQQPYPAPPYPSRPHPGQPHPGQPYPPQGPWGQPPLGPPPRANRTGRTLGIVAACVVGLAVLGFLANRVSEAGDLASGSGFPAATHRLTVPKSLLGGTYTLAQDLSQTAGKKALDGAYDPKIRNPEPAAGQYAADSGMGALVISGMYGQFKDPDSARRKMAEGAAEADGAGVSVPARDITPAGSGITLTCQVLTSKQQGTEVALPMCAWADDNTAATVAVVTPQSAGRDPKTVDLDAIARTTLDVREEARQPLG